MQYFILIKKKGSNRYSGVIPTKKNVSLSKVKSMLRRNLTRKYTAKIVTMPQLKNMLRKIKSRVKRRR